MSAHGDTTSPSGTFGLTEYFGVSHPDQLLKFPAKANPATHTLLKNGTEVPWQLDGDTILVRATGGVAANETHTWEMHSGPSAAASQVSVTDPGMLFNYL